MKCRKTNFQRWLGGCLAILLVTVTAACSNNSGPESSSTNSGTGTNSPSASEAVVPSGEKVHVIKWHGSFQQEHWTADNYVLKELEKRFNVKITLVNANADKLKLMASSKDLPDVFRLPDPKDVNAFGSSGATLELPLKLLEAQMPKVTKSINETDPGLWGLTNVMGKNYGIPQYLTVVPWDSAMTWRKDVLDAAGIASVPTTVEEYETAFKTIADKKKDVIARTNPGLKNLYMFSSSDVHAPHMQFTWLFGAYGSMPGSWQLDAQGKVVRGETLPGTKDALAKLREWYQAGYIDPAFVTDKGQQYDAKYRTGSIVMRSRGFSEITSTTPDDLQKAFPSVQYLNTTNPKGPTGKSGVWSWGKRQNFVALSSQLKNDPEKVNKILQILEAIATDEKLYKLTQWGIEGKSYSINNNVPTWLPPYDKGDGAESGAMGARGLFGPFGDTAIVNKFMDPNLVKEWKGKNGGKPDVIFMLTLPSSGTTEQRLIDKWNETFIKIVIGEAPLSIYDDYLTWVEANGGKQLTQEANDLYQTQFKK